MQRNRGWRRSQRERKIRELYERIHAQNWFAHLIGGSDSKAFEEYTVEQHEWALRNHSARQRCSGWCCGNPRTHFGSKTLAENRFDISCAEVYKDMEIRQDFPKTRKWW